MDARSVDRARITATGVSRSAMYLGAWQTTWLQAPRLIGSRRTLAVKHKRLLMPLAANWIVAFHKDQFLAQSISSATQRTLGHFIFR